MILKNVLIVVKDIERSKKFYKDIFGLDVILDNEGNEFQSSDETWKLDVDRKYTFTDKVDSLYLISLISSLRIAEPLQ